MTDTNADPFDRAAAREAELRERTERKERQRRVSRVQSFGSNLSGLAFFGFTLPIHWLVVQQLSWLVVAHMLMVALTATGAVTAWAHLRAPE